MDFLPTTLEEGKTYYGADLEQFEVIFITGDPYYDHPLSGVALLSRLLDAKGYKVGIVAQPETEVEFQACGKPKYFFCITSGLLDSALANYTPMLRKREGVIVPERALMVYTQKVKNLFPGSITVLGGVEATIRRFTHFDYLDNKLRRGILNDTKADMVLFGNAERSLLEVVEKLKQGKKLWFEELKDVEGAAFRIKKNEMDATITLLPSYEECVTDKKNFALLTKRTHYWPDNAFIEPCGAGFIQHNRPAHTLHEEEVDIIYSLPFIRKIHPRSKNLAFNERMVSGLKNSVILGRGCWGSCSFCIIPLVQGKEVAQRSSNSILKEIEMLYASGETKINDLTLPTLNMYGSKCALYDEQEKIYSPIIDHEITVYNKTKFCNQQCVGCQFRVISDDLYPLLEGIEKLNQKYNGLLELRSAVRHDIILHQKKLFRKIMEFVTRLKIAPEHISEAVLKQMNKGKKEEFIAFLKEYELVNKEQGTKKNLVPYFIAAHPGSTLEEMEKLKKFCVDQNLFVNLTQVFTPTPGTLSTAIYYLEENPLTGEKVYVPRTFREKKDQKNILLEEEWEDENG